MKSQHKLLLTTICRPLGPQHGDATSVGYELLHGQVTRAQGFFSPRAFLNHFSLQYIAHNLDTPTVVLQYPSERELVRELRREKYDFVGVSFVLSTFHKMKRMVSLIRKHSPTSKIVLGGYGTVLTDEELQPWGDYICREEGIGYLRKLLGEPERKPPYDHPLLINGLKVYSKSLGQNGMILAGLGCPNGCDFCCTSHFFKRQHIRLLPEGDDIFNLVVRYLKENPEMKFTVLDEDFLLNQKRARRFLELVRRSGIRPSMFVFSSAKALSQYTIEELLEMGVTGVWIGFEGRQSGYDKLKGKNITELFREFRKHGITTLASMIVGFDYQTPEIIQKEFDELMSLHPTFAQFLIYGPPPGTPFYERVMAQKKLLPEYDRNRELFWYRGTGFYSVLSHPTMTAQQIEQIQAQCFETDFKRLGPSIIRAVENWFLGYKNLCRSKNEALRQRAELYKKDILKGLPAFLPAIWWGPSCRARRAACRLYWAIRRRFGPISLVDRIQMWGAVVLALWTQITLKFDWFQHPALVRTSYRH